MRSLDAEEERLWARVAATIRPLSREPVESSWAVEQPKAAEPVGRPESPPVHRRAALAPRQKDAAHSRATLDSSWDRRLRSGAVEPDRVIDLHGMNLDRAWKAIDRGLEQAISARARVVLLITGHERSGEPPVERGKIRAAVHDWLAASSHAGSIAAVRGAHRRHGGGGSIYIILRRNRHKSTLS